MDKGHGRSGGRRCTPSPGSAWVHARGRRFGRRRASGARFPCRLRAQLLFLVADPSHRDAREVCGGLSALHRVDPEARHAEALPHPVPRARRGWRFHGGPRQPQRDGLRDAFAHRCCQLPAGCTPCQRDVDVSGRGSKPDLLYGSVRRAPGEALDDGVSDPERIRAGATARYRVCPPGQPDLASGYWRTRHGCQCSP